MREQKRVAIARAKSFEEEGEALKFNEMSQLMRDSVEHCCVEAIAEGEKQLLSKALNYGLSSLKQHVAALKQEEKMQQRLAKYQALLKKAQMQNSKAMAKLEELGGRKRVEQRIKEIQTEVQTANELTCQYAKMLERPEEFQNELIALGRKRADTEWQAEKIEILTNYLRDEGLGTIDEEELDVRITFFGALHALHQLEYLQ